MGKLINGHNTSNFRDHSHFQGYFKDVVVHETGLDWGFHIVLSKQQTSRIISMMSSPPVVSRGKDKRRTRRNFTRPLVNLNLQLLRLFRSSLPMMHCTVVRYEAQPNFLLHLTALLD